MANVYVGYKDKKAEKNYKKEHNKKVPLWGKFLIIMVIVFVLLGVAISKLYSNFVIRTSENIQYIKSDYCNYDESDGINILILGIDGRTGEESARSDMIMLCSLNAKKETMKLISFQRDLYVTIPEREGKDKLGHAFAYGEGDLAVQTMEENFGIEIDGYVVLNLASSLYQIIDIFGGTEVELSLEESAMINGYIFELNNITGSEYGTSYLDETTQGITVLDGRQAISYARIRYIGTDTERTSRQREVIVGILKNLKNELVGGNFMAIVDVYRNLPLAANCITTSISQEQIEILMSNALSYIEYEMNIDLSIPADGDWRYFDTDSGMSVIEWNVEATLEKIRKTLGIKDK